MSGWVVPLASPGLRDEDLALLLETYRSDWLAMGPRTEELERRFCEYSGAREAVAVSSGTAALHLACMTAGLDPGNAAVLPALTFVATASAVAYTGAEPRFADIVSINEPWLSPEAAADAADASTRAVVAMAYGGHLGEVKALARLAESEDLILVEDAAHASGSWLGGRHAGTFGRTGALSFSAGKNLGVGEGGILLSDDEDAANRARKLRWHGISASSWSRHQGEAPEYELGELGFNYRIDDPRAALATARLRRLDEDNGRRAPIAAAYRRAWAGEERLRAIAPPPEGERSSHYLFAVVLDPAIDRGTFRTELARGGIQTSVHFPPLHKSGVHAKPGLQLPATEAYASRSVSLPIFAAMTERQQEVVIDGVAAALAKAETKAAV